MARGDGFALRVAGEEFASADVGGVGFGNDEIGREGGGVDFVAVAAVADEGGGEAFALDGLF